jgi:3-mercaptopyruvate sulfurtransferase SseA
VVLYCSCPEDASAARGVSILMDHGYPNVFALEGGWNAWQAAGYPVATRELVAA